MALNLESVKYIHQFTKDTVAGYIRNIQSLLPHEENSFYIIPQLIQTIILIFYHGEYFTIAGNNIIINEKDPNKISFDHEHPTIYNHIVGTAYGLTDIDANSNTNYIWKFAMDKVASKWGSVFIAIESSRKCNTDSFLTRVEPNEGIHYGIYCDFNDFFGGLFTKTNDKESGIDIEDFNDDDKIMLKSGDTVSMELDVKHKTLKFSLNDKEQGDGFKSIKLESDMVYNMAVSLECGSFELSLIDFKTS